MAKSKINKNDTVRLKIDDLTDRGFGVGRVDGLVVFVADTVPGDEIVARIIKVNSSYLVGKVESFIEHSHLRYDGRCSEEKCHSCAYKNISYEEELKLKEEGVRHLFHRLGIEVEPIIPSPSPVRYRNKAQYPVAKVGKEYQVGFYMPKSHRVTPVRDCPIAPRIFADMIDKVMTHISAWLISVYNEETGEGLVRHIYLRRGGLTGETVLTLVVTSFELSHADDLVRTLRYYFPEIVGILLNKNPDATNVVLGEDYKLLWGRDYIYDVLCDVRLKIPVDAFYQVNHDAAELLYKKARELAKPGKDDTLIDLYCGVGSIGLSMARDVGELYGIEIVESAIECARTNAADNHIDNAHFYVGDAANCERLLEKAEREVGHKIDPDIIILDPPRAGCDEKLIRFVSSLAPKRIVYISCNPKTLARDVELFLSLGFESSSVSTVDMFPCSGHVESVVCLTRSDKAT